MKALVCHPIRLVVRRWNWKSALLSSLFRALIFFFANLMAGWPAAVGAMVTEMILRALTSGFYGAITEAFCAACSVWEATVTVMVLLPFLNHSLELLVHWMRGTPKLGLSIASSVVFTAFSSAFNLYAMKRGVLTVGVGSRSLRHDLSRILPLIFGFLLAGPREVVRQICRGVASYELRRSSSKGG